MKYICWWNRDMYSTIYVQCSNDHFGIGLT